MRNLLENFVNPIYLRLLHGNFLDAEDQDFIDTTRLGVEEATNKELDYMLRLGWREAITASWFISVGRYEEHLPQIRKNLIPSKSCFQGQFHLIALGRFETSESTKLLTSYLDRYLPVGENHFDQDWAYGSLVWISRKCGEEFHTGYQDSGLWEIASLKNQDLTMDKEKGVEKVTRIMEFIETHFPEFE